MRRWIPTLMGETLQPVRPDLNGLSFSTLFANSLRGKVARRIDQLLEVGIGYSPAKLKMLRRSRPSLLHVHFATDAVRIWPTAKKLGIPFLVTLHGYDINTHADWWRAGHGGKLMRKYPEQLLAMAQEPQVSFIAVSETIRRTALAYGLPSEKIIIKHIGIPTGNFLPGIIPPSKRGHDILFVGRLVEKKGANYLIQAASLMRSRVPTLRLILIGQGSDAEREVLEKQALELGVNAVFMGGQPHTEVRRQLGLARALCLPSITSSNGDAEGLPISVLEAQAAGVPVVTTATGGCAEAVVNGTTGFLVAERDVQHLAASLETLMLDGARADQMGKSATEHIRTKFDINTCTAELERHYDLLVDSA